MAAASLSLVVGMVVWQAVAVVLDRLDWASWPVDSLGSKWVGLSLVLVFVGLAVGAFKYSGRWSWWIGLPSTIGLAAGLVVMSGGFNTQKSWPLLSALAAAAAISAATGAIALFAFGRRSRVAQRAMSKVHFGQARLSDLGALGGENPVRHVICATEIQSGLHAFFSDAFVYSYNFGISSRTDGVPLALAVQASAALPGGFAPRRLPTKAFGFTGGALGTGYKNEPMILLDGGVYDNMADQWFVGLADRRARWPQPLAARVPPVDHLIVANASTGWVWEPLGRLARTFHLIREVAGFGKVLGVLYNTLGRRRRAHLRDRWRSQHFDEKGVFVEVNDNPMDRVSTELKSRLEEIGPEGGWERLVERSRTYPTVLRQVPAQTALDIMWHAYIVTALSVHRFFGVPLTVRDLPTLADFGSTLGPWVET